MGQFVNENLIKDEHVVYEAKIHWAIWLWPIVWAVIFAIPMVTIPLSIIILGWTLMKYKTIELAITNKRIIAKHGIISKHTIEQNLNKIESVQVHQGMLERMFGKGSVIITGTGGTKEIIPDIEDPFEFRKQFAELSA